MSIYKKLLTISAATVAMFIIICMITYIGMYRQQALDRYECKNWQKIGMYIKKPAFCNKIDLTDK